MAKSFQNRLTTLDRSIFRIEQQFTASLFLGMIGATFFDVLHRIFSRSPGRFALWLSALVSDGTLESATRIDRTTMPFVTAGGFFLIALGAYHTRASNGGPPGKLMLRALLSSISAFLGIQIYVKFLPEGMVWAPYFGLSCLLWLGLIGASMATFSGQHLALEMGEKIWPKRYLPYVKKVNAAAVALLCALLCVLGTFSVMDHYRDWASGPGAGLIPSIDWPKWLVFLVIPYAFGMMTLRYLKSLFGGRG